MPFRLMSPLFALAFVAAPVLAQPAKAPQPGAIVEIEIAKGVQMKLCWIPAGAAQLGSTKAERDECMKNVKAGAEVLRLATETEEKRGKFKTNGFWLGKYAVTQAEWTALMGKNPSHFVPTLDVLIKAKINDTSRFPVDNVSWDDSKQFVKKLNDQQAKFTAILGPGSFALPHEDQWEYACRGGKGNKLAYHFGNAHNGTYANSGGTHPFGTETPGPALSHPAKVGSYEKLAPHPWGLCDMHGNMWQWCENKYSAENDNRVVRGGAWQSGCRGARSACRTGRAPSMRTLHFGLRVAFVPQAPG